MIIVPTDTPGFKAVPIQNFGNFNTNYTFYEDVRVPYDNSSAARAGWALIMEQLNHERVTSVQLRDHGARLDDDRRSPRTRTLADGGASSTSRGSSHNLAWVHARLEVLRLLNWQVAWNAEQGNPSIRPPHRRSRSTAPSSTWRGWARCSRSSVRWPASATARPTPRCADRLGTLLRGLHVLTFGGGTNELQRDLIALFGLGLPPSPR